MILPKSKATLVRALHRRKGRREHGAFLVEGDRALAEIAVSDADVRFAFARGERIDEIQSLLPAATIYLLEKHSDALFATDNPQGVGAVVSMPRLPPLQELISRDGAILVLDGVSDPGNVGTILRSAEWFGLAGVALLNECADPFNPKCVRASMGAVVRVAIAETTVDELLSVELPLYALDGSARISLSDSPIARRALYVVGSEAHGVSTEIAQRATGIAIRGHGAIESLNAAVAASILCYELTRVDE
ncbi:MAG: RNA methyltransferase [bacterium]|nr:RNA methyltransferase [Candidatus Kapabacteria bacterium]